MATPALKGVAFDVDGTLLTSSHAVSPRMQATCRALVDKGVWLGIASARPPRSVRLIGEAIGATGALCALNGAIILGRDGAILNRLSLPAEVTQALIARFEGDARVSVNLYSGMDWIVRASDERIAEEAAIVGYGPELRPSLDGVGGVEKILLMMDETLAAALARELAQDDRIEVTRSKPHYVEIAPGGVDKARGVAEAARHAGLSLAEIAACGDGENDIAMVRRAGYGIAMAHAPHDLRAVARQVVGSNDDDSLPMALNALFGID